MVSNSNPTPVEVESGRVDLETILVREIGQFGKYQWRVLVVASLVALVAAFSAGEYLFSTARIPTRCLIPECENDTTSVQFAPSWILNAIPGDSVSSFDNCQRFASSSIADDDVRNYCPATLFDQQTLVACEEYVYENTNTVVYDFDLACDEWRRTLIGSMRTLGTLVALPITGFVSDRWGRRTALVINAFNTAWMGIVRYWADTYVGFVISEFVESALGAGTFSCIYILLLEIVGPKYRVVAGATMNTFFTIGTIIMALVAWGVPNWRYFTLALYVPQLLTIAYLWMVPESVRWFMSKGRFEEAESLLHHVARVNGKQLSEESLRSLMKNVEEEKKKQELKEEQTAVEPWLITLVFRHKAVLLRCVVSPVWWITATFVYYGLSINAVNMSGNSYLNFIAVIAVEIPGFWAGVVLMNRVGRRPVLTGGYWICAACQIGYLFISEDLYGVSLTVYLIGKLCISMVGTTMYVYTTELYPTRYRHSLFAFSSMMGRIGSILAPLTPALGASVWEGLPFVLFASLALLSGLLVLLTPETLGTKMPDTMEEASDIGAGACGKKLGCTRK